MPTPATSRATAESLVKEVMDSRLVRTHLEPRPAQGVPPPTRICVFAGALPIDPPATIRPALKAARVATAHPPAPQAWSGTSPRRRPGRACSMHQPHPPLPCCHVSGTPRPREFSAVSGAPEVEAVLLALWLLIFVR